MQRNLAPVTTAVLIATTLTGCPVLDGNLSGTSVADTGDETTSCTDGACTTSTIGNTSTTDSTSSMDVTTDALTTTTAAETDSGSDESSSSGGIPSPCGNGRLEEGEVCDDGNTNDGDGCNSDCVPGGQEVWTATFDGGLQLDDRGHRVTTDADDDVYVVGVANNLGGDLSDGLLIKYDDDGQFQWSERYDSDLPNSAEFLWGVAIAQDQSVVVSGAATNASNMREPVVRMYSPDGVVLWTHLEPDSGDGYAYDVVVDSLGDIVVTGIVHDPVDFTTRAWLAKFAPDGAPIWNQRLQVPTFGGNIVLAVDSTDALIMAGADGTSYVRKLDTDGVELWTWTGVLANPSGLWGATTGSADEIFVAGYHQAPLRVYLAQHPADGGDPSWTDSWAGTLGGSAFGNAIARDAADRLLVAGRQAREPQENMFVRKYDPDGSPVWLHEIPDLGPGVDHPYGVATDSLDHVIVSAQRQGPVGNLDVFVRKLTP